jgi:hypothetical protein
MVVNAIALIASVGIGICCAVFPERAAKQWGEYKIEDFQPQQLNRYFLIYRIFGIAFAIVAADSC